MCVLFLLDTSVNLVKLLTQNKFSFLSLNCEKAIKEKLCFYEDKSKMHTMGSLKIVLKAVNNMEVYDCITIDASQIMQATMIVGYKS